MSWVGKSTRTMIIRDHWKEDKVNTWGKFSRELSHPQPRSQFIPWNFPGTKLHWRLIIFTLWKIYVYWFRICWFANLPRVCRYFVDRGVGFNEWKNASSMDSHRQLITIHTFLGGQEILRHSTSGEHYSPLALSHCRNSIFPGYPYQLPGSSTALILSRQEISSTHKSTPRIAGGSLDLVSLVWGSKSVWNLLSLYEPFNSFNFQFPPLRSPRASFRMPGQKEIWNHLITFNKKCHRAEYLWGEFWQLWRWAHSIAYRSSVLREFPTPQGKSVNTSKRKRHSTNRIIPRNEAPKGPKRSTNNFEQIRSQSHWILIENLNRYEFL